MLRLLQFSVVERSKKKKKKNKKKNRHWNYLFHWKVTKKHKKFISNELFHLLAVFIWIFFLRITKFNFVCTWKDVFLFGFAFNFHGCSFRIKFLFMKRYCLFVKTIKKQHEDMNLLNTFGVFAWNSRSLSCNHFKIMEFDKSYCIQPKLYEFRKWFMRFFSIFH